MSNVQQLEKHLATKSYVDGYVVFLFSSHCHDVCSSTSVALNPIPLF